MLRAPQDLYQNQRAPWEMARMRKGVAQVLLQFSKSIVSRKTTDAPNGRERLRIPDGDWTNDGNTNRRVIKNSKAYVICLSVCLSVTQTLWTHLLLDYFVLRSGWWLIWKVSTRRCAPGLDFPKHVDLSIFRRFIDFSVFLTNSWRNSNSALGVGAFENS